VNDVEIECRDRGGRLITIQVPAEKADAMRALSALYDQIAEQRGRPYANAAFDALIDGTESGALYRGMNDDDAIAWLTARATAWLKANT